MKAATKKAGAKAFLALTAAELMTNPVMTIPHETSLREAARLLAGSHVGGAPVVDAEGHCLGVLSSRDFVTWVVEGEKAPEKGGKVTCFLSPWGEMIDIEDSAEDEIRRYMTARPVTVAPATPVGELAQKMADSHIHRVLVVEEQGRLCGIVTSSDVLAAVAKASRKGEKFI
jgi:CBS-domain-containing membrane protein